MGKKKTKKNKTKQKVNSMKGGKDIRREREKSPKKQNITKKEGKGKLVPIKKKKQSISKKKGKGQLVPKKKV